ncbi:hypothetical protein ACS0TY_025105 [Phlomoides rotata]
MASLPNKLIAQVAFKAGGDIFHDIVVNGPQQLTEANRSGLFIASGQFRNQWLCYPVELLCW